MSDTVGITMVKKQLNFLLRFKFDNLMYINCILMYM